MFNDVLIGVDGRQGGRDALALARQLVAAGGRLTMAHAYADGLIRDHRRPLEAPYRREDAYDMLAAERQAAAVEAELVTCAHVPPGRGLRELAQRRGSDLLVVGSTRHAMLGRVLMGDDTRAAFNGSPCAIAIAPRSYAHINRPFRTIALGYDDSAESRCALDTARELAGRNDAAITAMWVVSLEQVREESPVPADWSKTAGKLVDRCTGRLRQVEGVDPVAIYGGPREELARLSHDVDLLIVGSRGYGPLKRLIHGSVSSYLLRHVACPLLVLPRGAQPRGVPIAA
jgi:nucleotide-binding universal stress UspA family protein